MTVLSGLRGVADDELPVHIKMKVVLETNLIPERMCFARAEVILGK